MVDNNDEPYFMNFKCPVCNLTLFRLNNSYNCESNHTFDLAKEGYLNLLLAQHKRSKNPGDDVNMVRSRYDFLNAGYYDSLAHFISDKVNFYNQDGISKSNISEGNSKLIDIGCGEGFYLSKIKLATTALNKSLSYAGVDISKPAVKLAAKKKLSHFLAVASAYNLPFFDAQFDIALSVFSPVSPEEFSRVLSKNGIVILVGPGKGHLSGLAEKIYDNVVAHEGNYKILSDSEQFELIEQHEINEVIEIQGKHIINLLTMTPYYWHTKPEQQKELSELDKLSTPIHFQMNIYRKL
ncbi:MAG: 23S rRNA (guanine745-N1)-methyltransferase [Cocleimonas sp.]